MTIDMMFDRENSYELIITELDKFMDRPIVVIKELWSKFTKRLSRPAHFHARLCQKI